MSRPFKRVKAHAWLGGVCAGVAYALGIPTSVVRLLWALSVICLGFGGLIYVLLWLFMPRWPATPPDYRLVTSS